MRLRSLAVVAALVLTTPSPGTAGQVYAPRCHRLALSPAFAKDGTAFCVTWVRKPATYSTPVPGLVQPTPGTKDVGLYRTTDRGQSWRRLETDLPWDVDTVPGGLALSPLYATDKLLAIHVSNFGVYTSSDGGEHFVPADPAAVTAFGRPPFGGYLTPFTQTAGPRTSAAFAFFDPSVALAEQDPNHDPLLRAGWNGNSAIVPAPGGHVPVTGAPGLSQSGFQLSRTFGAGGDGYVLTTHVESYEGLLAATWRWALWACGATLDCTEQRTVFPDNWGAWDLVLRDPAGRRLGILLAERLTGEQDRPPRLRAWESADGGATWRPWAALERILAPFVRAAERAPRFTAQVPAVYVAVEPAKQQRVVVRVTGAWTDAEGKPVDASPYLPSPGEQVWVSDDGGTTFRRTAYGPSYAQRGRGTLPWQGADATSDLTLEVAPDGRIFTDGFETRRGRVVYAGLYCSRDGRRWARFC